MKQALQGSCESCLRMSKLLVLGCLTSLRILVILRLEVVDDDKLNSLTGRETFTLKLVDLHLLC